jgi:hypothetical protein
MTTGVRTGACTPRSWTPSTRPTAANPRRRARGDVTSVYATASKDRILDRVVDEYDGDTLNPRRTRSSTRPLSLIDLIDFFIGAWPLTDVLEGNNFDREGARQFTQRSSEVYLQFAAGI